LKVTILANSCPVIALSTSASLESSCCPWRLFHPCYLLCVRILIALLFRDSSFYFERQCIKIFVINFRS
jgi:hypothetical protein